MTKANDAARSRVKDAERRAKRKIRRLQKKGVATGSISPLKNVDPSNTRALNSYHKELEKFISRQTRFVAGYEGTPIPYASYRDFRRLERQWNKQHEKYWAQFANKPFLTAKGESDMTLGMRSRMTNIKGLPFKGIDYVRDTPAEKLKGLPDIERRSKIIKRELSPTYQRKRITNLRRNLVNYASEFNDPEIPNMIKKLSNEQLFALQNFTSFVPLYYRYINTDKDNDFGIEADSTEHDAQVRHLKELIYQAMERYPRTIKQVKGKKKRRTKRK